MIDLTTPAAFDDAERAFWLDLWRAPVIDAVEEQGIQTRRYGPVFAMVVEGCAPGPLLNPVLGAGEAGAVQEGHLEEALDWVESLDVDFRVPVTMEREEAGAAEELLNQRGYLHDECLVRFVRPSGLAGSVPPPRFEVVEIDTPTEGFSEFFAEGFDLDPLTQCFFDALPGREGWRCYLALEEHGYPMAAAVMTSGTGFARPGFAAIRESKRCRGVHRSLLRQRLLDAGLDRGNVAVAEVMEPLDGPPGTSPAARNLRRTCFEPVAVRPVWRPPDGSF